MTSTSTLVSTAKVLLSMSELHPPSSTPDGTVTPSDLEVGKEQISPDDLVTHPRKDLPSWKWILTLIGIYLGALLYGKELLWAPPYE